MQGENSLIRCQNSSILKTTIKNKEKRNLYEKEKRKKKLLAAACALAMLSCSPLTALAGTWQSDDRGWWYQQDDGSYPAGSWFEDQGIWYHFDESGYMQTGWIMVNGTYFYLEPSGAMRTDDLVQDGIVYHFNSDGSCINPGTDSTGSGDFSQEDLDSLAYSLEIYTWMNQIEGVFDDMEQWAVMIQNGRSEEVKTSIAAYRQYLEEFCNATPPTRYAAVHAELVLASKDILLIMDQVVLLADSYQSGTLTNGQSQGITNEMSRLSNDFIAHLDQASAILDTIEE